MSKYRMLAAGVAILLWMPVHAETYRWVDSEGKIHYSDTPPPPSAKKIEQKRLSTKPGATQPLPYELQLAVRNFPVTLFNSECGAGCTQARQLLAKRGVPHTEHEATEPSAQEELKKLTGGSVEVPVLRVGKQVLRGFEEGSWNRALDAAGYPKSALDKVTPNKPPPPKPAPPPEPPAASEPQPTEKSESEGEG